MCLLALAGLGAAARADVLFTNLGPGDDYLPRSGYQVGQVFARYHEHAETFTPREASYTLDRIEVAVGLASGPNGLTVSLLADDGGRPGGVVEAFDLAGAMGPWGVENPLLVMDSVLHPTLMVDTQYWLAVSPASEAVAYWNLNSPHARATIAQRDNGESWMTFPSEFQGAFRVTGTAVPEPGALALFILGASGLAGYVWRRVRAA
jgi:hypothetical protein